MSPFATNDLFHVLKAFASALNSVDVRTVAVCPHSEEHWRKLITSKYPEKQYGKPSLIAEMALKEWFTRAET